MGGAFRDDLDAARSRADALREENEELRSELGRLRLQGPDTPVVDPALARMAEHTLETLDQLTGDVDAPAEPPEQPDEEGAAPVKPPSAHPPPPRPRGDGRVEPEDQAEEIASLRAEVGLLRATSGVPEHVSRELDRLRVEVRRLRIGARKLPRTLLTVILVAFAAGVAIGALIR